MKTRRTPRLLNGSSGAVLRRWQHHTKTIHQLRITDNSIPFPSNLWHAIDLRSKSSHRNQKTTIRFSTFATFNAFVHAYVILRRLKICSLQRSELYYFILISVIYCYYVFFQIINHAATTITSHKIYEGSRKTSANLMKHLPNKNLRNIVSCRTVIQENLWYPPILVIEPCGVQLWTAGNCRQHPAGSLATNFPTYIAVGSCFVWFNYVV